MATIKITKKSMLSNIVRTQEFEMTPTQYATYCKGTSTVQTIFPELTRNEREFLISGITAQEWEDTMNEDEQASQETSEHLEQS